MSDHQRSTPEDSETFIEVASPIDGVPDAPKPAVCGNNKPVAMVGAGRLAASVWATIDSQGERSHTFNVFRINSDPGTVTQCFSADDVPDLVRLAEALTLVMAE